MLSQDLTTLGYFETGGDGNRALARFERRAKTKYRKTAGGQSIEETPVYAGPETGLVSGVAPQSTLDEIARWLRLGYRAPLGFYGLTKIGDLTKNETWGALRTDVAQSWLALMARIRGLGATIDGPYGDTKRPLMNTISIGASKFSFHVCGRAVDLNQGEASYFIVHEPKGDESWWRIYCKTGDQTGAQGEKLETGAVACYHFATHQESPIPAGYYLDLTAEIQGGGLFERIRSQNGWQQDTRKAEWWHYQWVPEKQPTFQDEAELIGITEQQMRAVGYGDADLDHLPG